MRSGEILSSLRIFIYEGNIMSKYQDFWTQFLNRLRAKIVTTTRPPKKPTTTRPPKRTTTTKPPKRKPTTTTRSPTTTTTTTTAKVSIILQTINRETIARLQNKNPITDRLVYLVQDPYDGVGKFIRNPSCWINGVNNISCFSPAQMSGTYWNQRAGTLITKKHIVYAKHFSVPIIPGGTPIIFVDEDNNIVIRNLISYAVDNDEWNDIAVGLLDNEVPDNIKIAKVLPPNYNDYLGERVYDLLVAVLDQEEKVSLHQCNSLYRVDNRAGFSTNSLLERYVSPEYAKLAEFSERIVIGDSGNPVFAIVNNELVLIGCWWTAMGGCHIGDMHAKINSMINSLSPEESYKLTSVELS